jgi:transcriptional regulator with XRE-family HTH domain
MSMDRIAFARFIRRAVDEAKSRRGWTVNRLAAETGVGRSTLFRWLNGDCQDYPALSSVRGFCQALDIPVGAAFAALGVPDADAGPETDLEPATRADIQQIVRRLSDPRVSGEEKRVIRDMLRYLANGSLPHSWAS